MNLKDERDDLEYHRLQPWAYSETKVDYVCKLSYASITPQHIRLVKERYDASMRPVAQLPGTVLLPEGKQRQPTPNNPMHRWKTPVPGILRSKSKVGRGGDEYVPLKDDIGKILGTFDVKIVFSSNAPILSSLLLETDGRFDVIYSMGPNEKDRFRFKESFNARRKMIEEMADDGFPSLGCVGAKRLLSWQNNKHWLTIKEGLIGLQAVADLQDASTNDFRAPCVFAVGVLPPDRPQQGVMVTIRMSVYLRQAIFGLSACAAIKDLFTSIDTPAASIQPCRSLMQPTYEFEKSSLPSTMTNQHIGGGRNDLHEFTLAGLLRASESVGVPVEVSQPKGLVDGLNLRDYQMQTLSWALRQEQEVGSALVPSSARAKSSSSSSSSSSCSSSSSTSTHHATDQGLTGLNAYFWEKREFVGSNGDLGSYYYFPMCGQLLLEPPPIVTGGLLAEEMGLGKTVIQLALILANPAPAHLREDLQNTVAKIVKEKEEKKKATEIAREAKKSSNKGRSGKRGARRMSNHDEENEDDDDDEDDDDNDEAAGEAVVGQKRKAAQVTSTENIENQTAGNYREVKTRRGTRKVYEEPKKVPAKSTAAACYRHVVPLHETYASGATLVIVPVSLLLQWEKELHTKAPQLKVIRYYGQDKDVKQSEHGKRVLDLALADVVLTTFPIAQELSRVGSQHSKLLQYVHWWRIVVDEIQFVSNDTSQIARAVQGLERHHTWMLSGTPLTSKIADLQGILSLLRVWPFTLSRGKDKDGGWSDWFWQQCIEDPWQQKDPDVLPRLHALMHGVVMQHSRFQSKLKESLSNQPMMGLTGASSASTSAASATAIVPSASASSSITSLQSPYHHHQQQQEQSQREPLVPMPPCEMKWVGLTIPSDTSEAAVMGRMELFALERLHFVESGGPDRNVLSKLVHQLMQCTGHAGTLPLI